MKRAAGEGQIFWILMLAAILVFGGSRQCPAAERLEYGMEELPERMTEQWEDLDQFLKEEITDGGANITFSGLMRQLMDGDLHGAGSWIMAAFHKVLFQEIAHGSHVIGQLLALGLIGAVFTGFSDIFGGGKISETGFFLAYLAAFCLMAVSFLDSVRVAGEVLEKQITFMKILMPSYFLAVAWSGAGISSAAWYELVLFLITAIQWLYRNSLLPLVRVHFLLSMAGHMAKEDMLSKMTELLKGGVEWSTRSLVGIVLGFQLIQGMVLPYADAAKTVGTEKLLQAIPGIGQGTSAVTKMLLASGVLIKNTMGAAAAVLLILLSLIPIVKLTVLLVLYRAAAAVMQPVADKRLVAGISSVADSQKLLLLLTCSGLFLFLLTIALICAGTNVTYLV